MNQRTKTISLVVLIAMVLIVPTSLFAGTSSRSKLGSAPPLPSIGNSDSLDKQAAADSFPEWLLLPQGVNESSVKNLGSRNGIDYNRFDDPGVTNGVWTVASVSDGKKVKYSYTLKGRKQFSLITTAHYNKMALYGSNGKLVKMMEPEDFFSDQPLAQLIDKPSTGPNLIGTALAAPDNAPENLKPVNKVRHNTKLSRSQIIKLASKAGFKGTGLRVATAVAQAESSGKIGNVLCNSNPIYNPKPFTPGVKECSRHKDKSGHTATSDRGVWQINNFYHKGVSNVCSFSPRCNAKAAYIISKHGSDWRLWATYNPPSGTPAYLQFMN